MDPRLIKRTIDLSLDVMREPGWGQRLMLKGSAYADRLELRVHNAGMQADLTGLTGLIYYKTAEGDVAKECEVAGHLVAADFPPEAYAVEGTLVVQVFLSDGTRNIPLYQEAFDIGEGRSDVLIDPDDIVPDLPAVLAMMKDLNAIKDACSAATLSADQAAAQAHEQAGRASSAANEAASAAQAAASAAAAANSAASAASNAGQAANTAAQSANAAAETANNAANEVSNAAQTANAAAGTANTAAGEATNAAKTASDAAEAANNAARSATSAGQEATTAAQSANAAKQAADTATSSANSAASNATTAAGNATSAAEAATNVANEIREAQEKGELDGVGIEGIATSRTPNENGEVDVTILLTDGRSFKYTTLATVTTESITAALGFTPANATELSQLSEAIGDNQEQLSQLSAEVEAIGTQEEIVQAVIAAMGTPVFGRVDDENNIILTGELADGTYTIKYEDADGNVTEIGTLNNVPVPTYTNVLPFATDKNGAVYNGTGYKVGARIGSSGTEGAVSNPSATNPIFLTGYIRVPAGATIRMKNCFIDTNGVNGTPNDNADSAYYGHNMSGLYGCMVFSGLDRTAWDTMSNYTWQAFANFSFAASAPSVDSNGYITEFTLNTTATKYIRMHLGGDPTTAIITINEPITD